MTVSPSPPARPLRFGRAGGHPRFSLGVMTVALATIGATLFLQPHRYDATPSYGLLLDILPQWAWALCYLLVAVLLGVSWWAPTGQLGRIIVVTGHTAGIALISGWLVAFLIRYATDAATTIVNPVSWSVFLALLIRSAMLLDVLARQAEPAHPDAVLPPDEVPNPDYDALLLPTLHDPEEPV